MVVKGGIEQNRMDQVYDTIDPDESSNKLGDIPSEELEMPEGGEFDLNDPASDSDKEIRTDGGEVYDKGDYSDVVDEFRCGDNLEERKEKADELLEKIMDQRRTRGIDVEEQLDGDYKGRGGL